MYNFDDAAAWCQARDKRLCFEDEWESACAGPKDLAYPYGRDWDPGVCNDEETWIVYSQSTLNDWPSDAANPQVDSLAELWESARSEGAAESVVNHLQELHQGEGGGDNAGCVGPPGVYDLTGNVEEWTRRRDGGTASFHGNLKGRYWAETRTCQSNLTSHGDGFRFYEIGFRCCWEPTD
jgi:formylglycine-generating enzyme required for sulfatase activity